MLGIGTGLKPGIGGSGRLETDRRYRSARQRALINAIATGGNRRKCCIVTQWQMGTVYRFGLAQPGADFQKPLLDLAQSLGVAIAGESCRRKDKDTGGDER